MVALDKPSTTILKVIQVYPSMMKKMKGVDEVSGMRWVRAEKVKKLKNKKSWKIAYPDIFDTFHKCGKHAEQDEVTKSTSPSICLGSLYVTPLGWIGFTSLCIALPW